MTALGSDDLSQALAALAHPVRRGLIGLIRARRLRVTELAARFAISLPAISRHLKVLEAAGLVTREVEGRDHYLTIRADGMDEVADWATRQSSAWRARLAALKDLMERPDG